MTCTPPCPFKMVATAEYITSKENVTNVFFSEITELMEPKLYRGDHSVLKSMCFICQSDQTRWFTSLWHSLT